MKQKIILLATVCVAFLLCFSCHGVASVDITLVGKWKTSTPPTSTIEFTTEDSFTYTKGSLIAYGTYTTSVKSASSGTFSFTTEFKVTNSSDEAIIKKQTYTSQCTVKVPSDDFKIIDINNPMSGNYNKY